MGSAAHIVVEPDGHVTVESDGTVVVTQTLPVPAGAIYVGQTGVTVRADVVKIWGDRLVFPGGNCLILARTVRVLRADGKPATRLTISTDGKDAGKVGVLGDDGDDGLDGADGVAVDAWPLPDKPLRDKKPTKGGPAPPPSEVDANGRRGATVGGEGSAGGDGGAIRIAVGGWNSELTTLRLTARGGRGGRGGTGGRGGRGGRGGHGAEGAANIGRTRLGFTVAQPGEDGGTGADGAAGGPGGPGGAGGNIELVQGPGGPRILFEWADNKTAAVAVEGTGLNIVVDLGRPGAGGEGGPGGAGGNPGVGGRGGTPAKLNSLALSNPPRLANGDDGGSGDIGPVGRVGQRGVIGSYRGFADADMAARAHYVSSRFAILWLYGCDTLLLQAGPGLKATKLGDAEARLRWLRDLTGPAASRVHSTRADGTEFVLDVLPAGPFAGTHAGDFARVAGLLDEVTLLTRIHAAAADRLRLLRHGRDMFGDPPELVPIETADALHGFAVAALTSLERCEAELAALDAAGINAGRQATASAALLQALEVARDTAAATLTRLSAEQARDAEPIDGADAAVGRAIGAFRAEAERTKAELAAEWQVDWETVIGMAEMIGFMPEGGFRMASMIAGQSGKLANVIHIGPPPGSADEAALAAMTTASDDLAATLGNLKTVAARIGGADTRLLFMKAGQVDALLAKVVASVPQAGMARLYLARLLAAARARADLILQHNLRADAIDAATARMDDINGRIDAAATALSAASADAAGADTHALATLTETVRMALYRPIFELVRCWRALTGEGVEALLDPALFGGASIRMRLALEQAHQRIARDRALARFKRQARPPALDPRGTGRWLLFTPESHPGLLATLRGTGYAELTIDPPGTTGSAFHEDDVRVLRIRPFLLGAALQPQFAEPIRVLIGIPRDFIAHFGGGRGSLLPFSIPFAQWRQFEYGWPAIANAKIGAASDGTPKFEVQPRLDLTDAMDVELIGSADGHDIMLTPYARWGIDASWLELKRRSGITALALELHYSCADRPWQAGH